MANQALAVVLQNSFKHGVTPLRRLPTTTLLGLPPARTQLRLQPIATLVRLPEATTRLRLRLAISRLLTPGKCQLESLLKSDSLLNIQILSKRYRHTGRLLLHKSDDIQALIELNMPKIEAIAKALQCPLSEAMEFARRDTRLIKGHKLSKVLDRIELLQRYAFTWHEIVQYPHAFNQSTINIEQRLKIMDTYKNVKMHLLACNRKDFLRGLRARTDKNEFKSRYLHSFIGHLFKLDATESLRLINQYSSIQMRRKSSLTRKVHEHLNNGHSMDEIIENLDMVLSTVEHLAWNVNDLSDDDVLKEHTTKQEYLQDRLQCTKDQIHQLFQNQPAFAKMRPGRLKGHLDMLLIDMELTPKQVFFNPHLLIYSQERTRYRFQTLQDLNLNVSTNELISALILNNSNFERKYGSSDIIEMSPEF